MNLPWHVYGCDFGGNAWYRQGGVGRPDAAVFTVVRPVHLEFFASVAEIAEVASRFEIPFIFDIGSGSIADVTQFGLPAEPRPQDAIAQGERVVIVDDLIATGGTMEAAVKLVRQLGGDIVECAFIVELPDLKGREKIKDLDVFTLCEFEGE